MFYKDEVRVLGEGRETVYTRAGSYISISGEEGGESGGLSPSVQTPARSARPQTPALQLSIVTPTEGREREKEREI